MEGICLTRRSIYLFIVCMGKQSSCKFCHYFASMVHATKLATGLNYILYVSYGSVVYLLTDKLNICAFSLVLIYAIK